MGTYSGNYNNNNGKYILRMFTRLNAVAFLYSNSCRGRCLFEGGVKLRVAFIT